jgi:hypothetical protein
MRRLFAVPEAGYGTEVVALADEMGPGVEPVIFVSEAGYGSEWVFISACPGPGIPLVFAAEGAHNIAHLRGGRQQEPAAPKMVLPNKALLSAEDDMILARLDARWSLAAESEGRNLEQVRLLLEECMLVIDRQWPEPIWAEDVMHKACVAATTLASGPTPGEAAPALKRLAILLTQRDWLFGGHGGYLEAGTAQGVLSLLPVAEQAAAGAAENRAMESSRPAQWAPDPFGRHEFRYWDGVKWTDQVADNGAQSTDEIGS